MILERKAVAIRTKTRTRTRKRTRTRTKKRIRIRIKTKKKTRTKRSQDTRIGQDLETERNARVLGQDPGRARRSQSDRVPSPESVTVIDVAVRPSLARVQVRAHGDVHATDVDRGPVVVARLETTPGDVDVRRVPGHARRSNETSHLSSRPKSAINAPSSVCSYQHVFGLEILRSSSLPLAKSVTFGLSPILELNAPKVKHFISFPDF